MTNADAATSPPSDLPEIDPAAMNLVSLAHIESRHFIRSDSAANRLAVMVYLWAVEHRNPYGDGVDLWVYPSLNDLRAILPAMIEELKPR
jgi:hypothetical protein